MEEKTTLSSSPSVNFNHLECQRTLNYQGKRYIFLDHLTSKVSHSNCFALSLSEGLEEPCIYAKAFEEYHQDRFSVQNAHFRRFESARNFETK